MAQIATNQQQIVWALQALAPGAQWVLNSDTNTSGLGWVDTVIPRPTDNAIAAWITANPNGPIPLITNRQYLLQIWTRLGKTEVDVLASLNAIATASSLQHALIAWKYGGILNRSDPLFTQLATTWAQTAAQMDADFWAASIL